MAHYNVTLHVAHEPLTWRESRYFKDFHFSFNFFDEIQDFVKEKLEDKNLPCSGDHYITIIPVRDDGTAGQLMIYKYARWQELATGDYSHVDEDLFD